MNIRLASRGTTAADEIDPTDGVDEPPSESMWASDDGRGATNHSDSDVRTGDDSKLTSARRRRPASWTRVVVFIVLPVLAMVAAGAVGYLRYQQSSLTDAQSSRISSVQAARDATVAILSYRPDTVEKDLAAAQSKLTGNFRDTYASLTKDVVIPGAKQKQVSAEASVPATASVSASANHAVVLVFVNQAVVVGNDAPASTMSSVRVTLDKVGDTWLVSGFDPV